MDHEQVFAEEAQEEAEAQAQQSSSKNGNVTTTLVERDTNTESSPLLGTQDGPRKRQTYARASKSYQQAIDEPWKGAHGQGHLPWYKTPSVFWLLPAFFPFCVGFGGILVPRTYLVLDLICKNYLSAQAAQDPNFSYLPVVFGGENQQCRIPEVQSRVAYFNTYQDVISGLLSAIVSPYFGALSDRVGRKKVIVLTSMGMIGAEVITIIIGQNPDTVSVYWMLLGSFFDGIGGSFTTALALAFAFASDCSAPEKRAIAFGYFHGILFSGIALGPLFAAYLIKKFGTVMVCFYFAIACHGFFLLFTTFVVPESLSKERQLIAREKYQLEREALKDQTWRQTIGKFNMLESLWILWPKGEGTSPALRLNLSLLAAIDTLMFGVAMGTMRILLIYAEYRYDWDAAQSSIFISACNVLRVAGLLGLLPLLTRLFRSKSSLGGSRGSDRLDLNIIRSAILFDLTAYLGYAFAPSGTVLFASGLFAAIGGIGSPTLSSSLTKHVPPDKTGQILGASGLLHALARVVAPVTFNMIYAHTVKTFAGFVFLCLGSLFVVMFIMSWLLKPNVYLKDESLMEQEPQTSMVDQETN